MDNAKGVFLLESVVIINESGYNKVYILWSPISTVFGEKIKKN